jgi:RNA polymerase sigma-70 factor (ECF subfamily)
LSLEQLINDCKKNDIKAQEQLYKLYSSKLFSVCLKYSSGYQEAQDNLQESFLLIFEKIHQYTFKGSFEGWAKRTTINYVLQQYRTKSFLNVVDENLADIEDVEIEENDVSMEFLLKTIQELPERYRLVFNLFAIEGYSHPEIAEMLNITIGTSKSNLSRARLILKEKIESSNGNHKIPFVK